ncbi:MAG: alpha/beta fold hydrolase, partial [Chlorobiaceae bacterium]|nr:alpha/beta fold hydrolase [Chlorobiaceae bacterium]
MSQQFFQRLRTALPYLLGAFACIAVILVSMLKNSNTLMTQSHPHPAKDYAEAMKFFSSLQAEEPENMNPACRSRLLTHGNRTEKAIILVHGYTSSPAQFLELGKQFFDAGYNVLIATFPHHGLTDRMTKEHGRLTADELAIYADRTVDIASGLGNRVSMLGLSAGGVTTAWAAQNRKEIDTAVLVSPAFAFRKIPTILTYAAMVFYRKIPDSFEWWDPEKKENGAPPYAYPQYSRHALTELLRLGFTVKNAASEKAPAAKKIILV